MTFALRMSKAVRALALGAATAVSVASAAAAATVDFTFSFTNIVGGGFVTGIVRGLTDNATSAATSVEVLTNTAGFGLGEYVGTPLSNTWTVANGALASFSFLSSASANLGLCNTCASAGWSAGLAQGFFGLAVTDLTLTLVEEPAPIPLPASAGLLLAALGGLGGLTWRRRRMSA